MTNKINMMIRNNFLGKEIVKQPHTIICGMPDLLDFSAPIFDKTIDTSLLNRIQIESDYELKKFSKLISLEYGKIFQKKIVYQVNIRLWVLMDKWEPIIAIW